MLRNRRGGIDSKSPFKHPAVPKHKNPHKKGEAKEVPTYISPGWPQLKK